MFGIFAWKMTQTLKQSLEKGAPNPPLVYLLSFAQSVDAYGIMIIIWSNGPSTIMSQNSLILLFDITSDYTKYIKKGMYYFLTLGKWEKQ